MTRSRIVHNSSSENLFNNSARIGFVLFPWFKSYYSVRKSRRSISGKRERRESRIIGGASRKASSREKTSFLARNYVEPKADSAASLKVGCSNNWSSESMGDSSHVPCLLFNSKPDYLPFLPCSSLPQRR